MIGILKKKIADIPSLVVVRDPQKYDILPVITYFHGFTSAKEHNLPLAFLLAEKGFRVILPDSKYHGEREGNTSLVKKQLSFFDIVLQNIKELEIIYEELNTKGFIPDGKFGVAGTSMGGITTAAALTQYPWIKAAAVLMGSPKLVEFAQLLIAEYEKVGETTLPSEEIEQLMIDLVPYDLSKRPEKLAERPVMFWHGDIDPVVPFDHSFTFFHETRKMYKNKKNFHFIKEVNRDHKVSREAILETVNWFEKQM